MKPCFGYKTKRLCVQSILLLLQLLLQWNCFGQDKNQKATPSNDSFAIRSVSFLLPLEHPGKKYLQAFSINYVVVPKDWTLDVIRAPMFCYHGKYDLPKGFDVQASVSTLFISTRATLGPFWNYDAGRYHFGAGYQVAFNYGILNQFGFKTQITIWEQQPTISAGYDFGKTTLVVKGDLFITSSISESQAGHAVPFHESFVNGYGGGAYFEQRLWKNRIMFIGAKANYLRYHFVAWPAFPVNQYRYWVPEIHLGLVF